MSKHNYSFIIAALLLDIFFTAVSCKIIEVPLKAVLVKAVVMILIFTLISVFNKLSSSFPGGFYIYSMLLTYLILIFVSYAVSGQGSSFIETLVDSHSKEAWIYIYGSSLSAQVISYLITRWS